MHSPCLEREDIRAKAKRGFWKCRPFNWNRIELAVYHYMEGELRKRKHDIWFHENNTWYYDRGLKCGMLIAF